MIVLPKIIMLLRQKLICDYMGESDGERKRKIRVSFILPEKLEGDTIHVHLQDYYGLLGAEAFSAEDFSYQGKTIVGHNYALGAREKVCNMTFRRRIIADCVPPYSDFIANLRVENNGDVREDFLLDCRELSQRLQKLERTIENTK